MFKVTPHFIWQHHNLNNNDDDDDINNNRDSTENNIDDKKIKIMMIVIIIIVVIKNDIKYKVQIKNNDDPEITMRSWKPMTGMRREQITTIVIINKDNDDQGSSNTSENEY